MLKGLFRRIREKLSRSVAFGFVWNKYVLVTIMFLVVIIFLDNNSIINYISNLRTVARQSEQIRYYEKSIKQADEQLKELQSNRDSLERFAREQYLFHRDDEDVYIIRSNDGSENQGYRKDTRNGR
ncbi:MAG: septum formation initiator family protein [Bacteroidales bacterium]|jgi:cell division protein FtsB|nr:septum formation initiator family protein [Bacteroidales bacterium]